MKVFLSRLAGFLSAALLVVAGFSNLVFAAPFAPGETLDPGCLPTDPTCKVINVSVATSTNNFGVGTTSPYAKLSVVGEIVGAYFTGTTTATSTFGGPIVITSVGTSTFSNGINLSGGCFAVNGSCISGGGGSGTVGSGTQGQLGFYNSAGTALTATSSIFLAQSGNVGIGTTSPYAKLSVVGQVVAEYFSATSTTATSSILGVFSIGSSTPNGGALFTVGSSSALFTVNKLTGNVGIGTTSPYAKLSITGATAITSTLSAGTTSVTNLAVGNTSTSTFAGNIALTAADASQILMQNGHGLRFNFNGAFPQGYGNGDQTIFNALSAGSADHFVVSNDTIANLVSGTTGTYSYFQDATASAISFFGTSTTGTQSGKVTILSTGSVGIGTTSPYSKLSVAGQVVAANFVGTTTASSTFAGPLVNTSSATSTFTQGINLTSGCFAISGTCVSGSGGGGSGTVNSSTLGYIAYYAANGTAVSGTSTLSISTSGALVFNGTTTRRFQVATTSNDGSDITAPQFELLGGDASVINSGNGFGGAVLLRGGNGLGDSGSTGGAVTIRGGTGYVGGAVSMLGGDSSIGGAATFRAGDGSSGNGGTITVRAGDETSGSGSGGAATFRAGDAVGGAGSITVRAGDGNSGGAATFRAGDGASAGTLTVRAGNGSGLGAGSATIAAGNDSGGTGGSLTLRAGDDSSGGTPGTVTVRGGEAGVGGGGAVTVRGGDADTGGAVTIRGGNGTGTLGGTLTLKGGNDQMSSGAQITLNGGSSGSGGNIDIAAGAGEGGSTVTIRTPNGGVTGAGDLTLYTGNAGNASSGDGGDIRLYTGVGDGTGLPGNIFLGWTGSTFRGMVSIGSSTPYAGLSVMATSGKPSFAVGSSTTQFIITENGRIGIGTSSPFALLALRGGANSDGTTWNNASSRALKENFTTLDPEQVIAKISELSIPQWNYKSQSADVRHVGPIAEEFYEKFGLGGPNANQSISSIDPAGLALLAIQGIDLRFKQFNGRIPSLGLLDLAVEGGRAVFNTLFAKKIVTDELCIEDVCVNKTQLAALLAQNSQSSSGGSSGSGSTGTPAPTEVDTEAPVLTLIGSSTLAVPMGTNFADMGATATDNVDQSVEVIQTANTVNTTVAGTYEVSYSATDAAGNTGTITRTIIVGDGGGSAEPAPEQLPDTGSSAATSTDSGAEGEFATTTSETSN